MAKSVVGLFAGIGGLELGLSRSGFETVAIAENDPFASSVLSEKFPEVENLGDISKLSSLPVADVLTAGFPCQDLSQAGRLMGIHGQKSSLVADVFRLLEKSRKKPSWVLFENVPFLLHLGRGTGMSWLIDMLEDAGFTWAYRIVDSQAFGLPQRRRRLFVLASQTLNPQQALLGEDATPVLRAFDGSQACGFYWTEGNTGLGWAVDAVPPLKGTSGLGIVSPPGIWLPKDRTFITPSIRDAEQMQGLERDWTLAAEALGRGDRARWKLVGNAVSVPVATWIGRRLTRDTDGVLDSTPIGDNGWPKAAWGRKGERFQVKVSEWPVSATAPPLESVLEKTRRSLSLRAAEGFMKRLFSSTLRARTEFKQDLKDYVDNLASSRDRDFETHESDARAGQSFRKGRPIGSIS